MALGSNILLNKDSDRNRERDRNRHIVTGERESDRKRGRETEKRRDS